MGSGKHWPEVGRVESAIFKNTTTASLVLYRIALQEGLYQRIPDQILNEAIVRSHISRVQDRSIRRKRRPEEEH